MALTVNTNVASLNAQRSLGTSQNMLGTSLERLSTGLRINSAKDDAAGLAISERFTAQINGLNQGVRNANDAISLVQTAEGALKEVTSNLQRIRELAVQSANATNSDSDRAALQSEVSQLVAEIERVSNDTNFNSKSLLDGTFTNQTFQIGSGSSETITVAGIDSAKTADLGSSYSQTVTSGVTTSTVLAGSSTVNGIVLAAAGDDGVSTDGNGDASALSKANSFNEISARTGVTATATTEVVGGDTTLTTETATDTFLLNDVLVSYTQTGSAVGSVAAAAEAINEKTSQTGITAAASSNGEALVLTAADGRNIEVAEDGANTAAADLNLTAGSYQGKIELTGTLSTGITIVDTGGNDQAALGAITLVTAGGTSLTGGLDAINIASVTGSSNAIDSIDSALSTISSTRATLGSIQNRFESVVANAQTSAENLSASRSRIVDADFAAETAQMTKAQILQQSGIAMLAQANSIPQNVLALLQ